LRTQGLQDVSAVIDLVDVDSQKWVDYAGGHRGPRRWLYALEGRRLAQLEQTLAGWATGLTFVSDLEADLFRRSATHSNVHVITNGVDLEYFQPNESATETDQACVFVGALDYHPNIDAACWFSAEVWPEVRRRFPEATLRLVGRRPCTAVQRLAQVPGIEIIGQVEDVRPQVSTAAVVLAPLRIARGIQNKVLEGMAVGKPVVASPQALQGLGRLPELPILRASTPADWVEALDRLFAREPLRRQLGAAGRRYVETHHSWDRCLQPFATLLGLDPSAMDTPVRPGYGEADRNRVVSGGGSR
jgi:sugar transferase (PEP-CTERM/EpsH1 system associated)